MFCWFPNCTIERNHFGPLLLPVEHTAAALLVYRRHEFLKCLRNSSIFPSRNVFQTKLNIQWNSISFSPPCRIHSSIKGTHSWSWRKKKSICILKNQVEKSQPLYKCNICGSLSQLQRVCICWGHLTRRTELKEWTASLYSIVLEASVSVQYVQVQRRHPKIHFIY